MRLKTEKNSGLNRAFEHMLCVSSFMHSLVMIIIYWYITNSQNDQLPDGLIAQLIEHGTCIADVKIWHPSRFHFRGPSLKSYKECDMSLRDIQTIHVSNMLARDSVILLLSAVKMVNTDLFTSSLVHFRRLNLKVFHAVKNCDVCKGAIQVLFRSVHLVRETLLNGRF